MIYRRKFDDDPNIVIKFMMDLDYNKMNLK